MTTHPIRTKNLSFIGSHVPRRCGIATFTSDICMAVATEYPETKCIVGAVNDRREVYDYPDLLADIGTPRQRALLKAMVFARLLFPCSKLALKDAAQGTLLAAACGLPADEDFDEDDLYAAMDSLTGHWCALEKKLATETFKTPVSLALYDLTSVYFEGSGPAPLARYGHSRDHRSDRPQIILAVATDTHGTPLHISILRGNRADSTTLRSTIKILRRRFQIPDAVFVFDGGMSSKINLQSLEDEGLEFVTRLSNSSLEALLKDLPGETQLELTDAQLAKLKLLHLFAAPPAWAKNAEPTQP